MVRANCDARKTWKVRENCGARKGWNVRENFDARKTWKVGKILTHEKGKSEPRKLWNVKFGVCDTLHFENSKKIEQIPKN